eukprot:scaffold13279_cov56-Phaeocystis_antarctica.AAC.3
MVARSQQQSEQLPYRPSFLTSLCQASVQAFSSGSLPILYLYMYRCVHLWEYFGVQRGARGTGQDSLLSVISLTCPHRTARALAGR